MQCLRGEKWPILDINGKMELAADIDTWFKTESFNGLALTSVFMNMPCI